MPRPTVNTLNCQLSPAEICRRNKWTVGTRIAGKDEYTGATEILEITAIGRVEILAVDSDGDEGGNWYLEDRDWRKVKANA